jgi:hypothetical protein
MADTTKFTLEGSMTLAYYASEMHGKRVLVDTPEEEDVDSGGEVAVCECTQESLEVKIANELNFPNDVEFEEVFRKLDELRSQGLRTEEGTPDGTREVQLRITVEVL